MKYIFRAYDVRGVFNRELTAETAARIGMAFGSYLGGGKRVLVGRDTRTSSEILEAAFSSGLASTGCHVYSTGMVPIPTANFAVWRGGYDAGAYITASHNPPEYNGVRFRHPDGSGYTKENEKVKGIFFKGSFKLADWRTPGAMVRLDPNAAIAEYSDFLLPKFRLERPLKAVLDTGNGAACLTAPRLLMALGCEVTTINAQPDGTFPGRPSEPSEESLGDLQKTVRARGADFGAGYDGDGDRAVFVDDLGRVVQTEKIGIIVARELLAKRKGRIVANVSCSMIVEREIEKLGGKVERVRVGDVFVCEAIKRHKALFAMETSAHYFLPSFYIFDDPVLMTLQLAEILAKGKERLSELVDAIPSYPTLTENLQCPDEVKFQVMDGIIRACKAKGYKLDLTDGVKLLFDDGWALLRPSNTNPLIRAAVEAETEGRAKALLELVKKEFKKALGKKGR